MYYDILIDYLGLIKPENFYYNLPNTERREIIRELKRLRVAKGINSFTYDAIIDNSISSLEYLMIVEYEDVIDGDCDSIIFNIK